jgi:signal transduction histidine kinase
MNPGVKRGEGRLRMLTSEANDAAASRAWEIALSLFGEQDTGTLLKRTVEAVSALSGADAVIVLLYDRERSVFFPTAPSVAIGLDERWLQRQGLEAAQELARRAGKERLQLDLKDAGLPIDLELPRLADTRLPRTVGVLPLHLDDTLLGALELFFVSSPDGPAGPPEMQAFAGLAARAIANAQARDRADERRTRLEALDEAGKILAAELSPLQVLQRIVEIATSIVGARYGALGVVGDDGYLTDFITTGLSREERERIGDLPRGHGLLGTLIRLGRPLRVPDMRNDPRRIGFPPNHPPMTSLLGVPIRVHNTVVGDLYLTDKIAGPEFSSDDQHLIEQLAAHAGIAIENARLYAQAGEVSLVRERERIGRDLHDGIIQDIYAATLQLEDIAEDIEDGSVRTRLTGVADRLSDVITDVRTYIQGLRARQLEGRLLADAVALLVREADGRGGAHIAFILEGDTYRLPDNQANTLLHLTREALANVAKHADASQGEVRLAFSAVGVTLTVTDDGKGFDPELAQGTAHHGLRNLHMRAADAAGTFAVRSSPGGGTTITAAIPRSR